jgi:hypothetical protein
LKSTLSVMVNGSGGTACAVLVPIAMNSPAVSALPHLRILDTTVSCL